MDKARAIWTEGLPEFPDNAQLKERLARNGDDLKTYIYNELDLTSAWIPICKSFGRANS